jgi:hypothetical protein
MALRREQKPVTTPKPAPPEPAAPAPPAVIPLADIAARATEVSNLLSSLTTAAAPNAQIENIAKSIPDLGEKLDAQFAATTTALEAEPTLKTLQSLQQRRIESCRGSNSDFCDRFNGIKG